MSTSGGLWMTVAGISSKACEVTRTEEDKRVRVRSVGFDDVLWNHIDYCVYQLVTAGRCYWRRHRHIIETLLLTCYLEDLSKLHSRLILKNQNWPQHLENLNYSCIYTVSYTVIRRTRYGKFEEWVTYISLSDYCPFGKINKYTVSSRTAFSL
jgi:hypothetical protein